MKQIFKILAVITIFTFGVVGQVLAATTINLGTVNDFAVLAGSAITNTGATTITGQLGLSPGLAVTGFPPGTSSGAHHLADAVAVAAKLDLSTAYDAANQSPVTTVSTELGGTTKNAGVYDSADGTFGLTGTLTLDAQGNPDAVFIFKTASTLITAGASNINLINGAQACNVFWQVGSSATLGVNSTFKGNILALTSVTLTTGANVEGRVLARNGAVTLDTNTITKTVCTVAVVEPTPEPTPTLTPVPPAPLLVLVTTTEPTLTIFTPTPTPLPAIAEVAPKLPDTGIAPDNNDSKIILISFGILLVTSLFYLVRRKYEKV